MGDPVIIGGARTGIGRLLGSLAGFSAVKLGGFAIKGALDTANIRPDQVEYVIMGHVLQAGTGQITSRQAAVKAGVPDDHAGHHDQQGLPVRPGRHRPGRGPDTARRVRHHRGRRHGVDDQRAARPAELAQGLQVRPGHDGRHDGAGRPDRRVRRPVDGRVHRAAGKKLGISRQEQDEFAARSQQRAARATKDGILSEEIVPVEIKSRKDTIVFKADEGIRGDTTVESLAKLPPAFGRDGTITAGSASQISDGAAALVVADRETAIRLNAPILAEVGAFGTVAGPDNSLHSQPANAIKKALKKAGRTEQDLDLIEINEAFAAVGIQSMRELQATPDKVNVNGGAIAVGHPLGASGARVALTLIYELRRRGGGLGAAALCGGGGQGSALLFNSPR